MSAIAPDEIETSSAVLSELESCFGFSACVMSGKKVCFYMVHASYQDRGSVLTWWVRVHGACVMSGQRVRFDMVRVSYQDRGSVLTWCVRHVKTEGPF